jgi:hypothetical protein
MESTIGGPFLLFEGITGLVGPYGFLGEMADLGNENWRQY